MNVPVGVAAVLLARRKLAESRAPGRRRIPDLPGTLLFAIAIGTLVLGIVKGQDWGWGSPRIIGCLAAALGLGAAVIWRCRRHRWPILDLSLLKIRTFSVANAMTVIGGWLLRLHPRQRRPVLYKCLVLFGPAGWRCAHHRPGCRGCGGRADQPADPAPRPPARSGRGGPGVGRGGAVVRLERVGVTPDFARQWLPGMVLLGIGAGTLFPNLSGTAVASAPDGSFATATGMNSVARQIGAALGVAVVVAIIGTPTPTAYAVFHDAWTFGAVCLFVAGLGCLLVGHVKLGEVPAPGQVPDAELGCARRCRPRRCCAGQCCASGSRGRLSLKGLARTASASQRVIALGNSVRSIEFCRKLVAAYNVHVFDSLVTGPGRSANVIPGGRGTSPGPRAWSR